MFTYPTTIHPISSKTSGILSAIPLSDLHIDDLLAGAGFRFPIIKTDGANVNKAAMKMITAELQNRRGPLVVEILCAIHALNNSTILGAGRFPIRIDTPFRPCV